MIGKDNAIFKAKDGQEAIKIVDENKDIICGMFLDLKKENTEILNMSIGTVLGCQK